jgi:hypothetical protein
MSRDGLDLLCSLGTSHRCRPVRNSSKGAVRMRSESCSSRRFGVSTVGGWWNQLLFIGLCVSGIAFEPRRTSLAAGRNFGADACG